jgi:hypothetical protein
MSCVTPRYWAHLRRITCAIPRPVGAGLLANRFNIHHHRGWAAVPLSSSTITVAGLTHSPASRLLQVILRQMHDRRDATILGSCQTHYLPHTPTRRSRLAGEPVSTSTITVAGLTHSPASRLLQVILRQMHDRRDATIFGSCQTHHLRHTPIRMSRLAGEPRRDWARAVGVWRNRSVGARLPANAICLQHR